MGHSSRKFQSAIPITKGQQAEARFHQNGATEDWKISGLISLFQTAGPDFALNNMKDKSCFPSTV